MKKSQAARSVVSRNPQTFPILNFLNPTARYRHYTPARYRSRFSPDKRAKRNGKYCLEVVPTEIGSAPTKSRRLSMRYEQSCILPTVPRCVFIVSDSVCDSSRPHLARWHRKNENKKSTEKRARKPPRAGGGRMADSQESRAADSLLCGGFPAVSDVDCESRERTPLSDFLQSRNTRWVGGPCGPISLPFPIAPWLILPVLYACFKG